MDKLTREESKGVAMTIEIMNPILSLVNSNLDSFKKAEKELKEDLSHYEAMGCLMEPMTYELNSANKKALLKRLSAIINLIEVFNETQSTISEFNEKEGVDSDD